LICAVSYSRGVRVLVEQVLQVATKVLDASIAPREAVTILASLTHEAVPAARELRRSDPERADAYAELLVATGRELRTREKSTTDVRHLRAVLDDLAKVLNALKPT
jgi:hypothetical protein